MLSSETTAFCLNSSGGGKMSSAMSWSVLSDLSWAILILLLHLGRYLSQPQDTHWTSGGHRPSEGGRAWQAGLNDVRPGPTGGPSTDQGAARATRHCAWRRAAPGLWSR